MKIVKFDCMKEMEEYPNEYCDTCKYMNDDPDVGVHSCENENFILEELLFSQQIAIIKYIITNMKTIINNGLLLTEVIEKPHKHPHYESCVTTLLEYDEEEGLVHVEARSGSPSAVNHYKTPVDSILNLSRWIAEDINTANNILSHEDEDVSGWVIEIEGV